MLERPYLADEEARLRLEDSPYTEQELTELGIWNVALFRIRESWWFQYRSGAIDQDVWNSYRNVLVDQVTRYSTARQAWVQFSPILDPSFVHEIESHFPE